ncbi:hypothetical protein [Pedobacter roseus]|uniref:Uncharacterized protein n=1 Tax=Pedobacter roseus TaxID=336820 RepID=A0A7G9QHV9_9SPHI|nr:hypothetical protein [Pedobacter roseus]QNN42934.1 hypothetical protein H9L23_02170 [Pedobacter roseus]
MTTQTHTLTCRCKFKFEITVFCEEGNIEDEGYSCFNCGKEHSFRASMPIQGKDVQILEEGIRRQPEDLDPCEVYRVLREKGADSLHHANTALTSYTFIKEKKLLSRKYVVDHGLQQTSQYTDKSDDKFGIFDDIFMDAVDIHLQAGNRNQYGPILFKFPLELLNTYPLVFVRVTRQNPSDWSVGQTVEKRYYMSIHDFEKGYALGNFSSMLIFPYINGELDLMGNLKELVIDSPKLQWGVSEMALEQEFLDAIKVKKSIGEPSKTKLRLRKCNEKTCGCTKAYRDNDVIARKMFGIEKYK